MNAPVPRPLRERAIGAGLAALGVTGLPRLAVPVARGVGAILMFHHVRPWAGEAFAPNRGLEITPAFLDATLVALRENGFEIISLDEAAKRLEAGAADARKPFAVLTFDDGYRDNLVHALPVLERHGAPFTVYVTTGFAERTARLWWVELEEAIRRLERAPFDGERLFCGTDAEKAAVFAKIYGRLRAGSKEFLLDEVASLKQLARVDGAEIAARLCMDWDEIATMARHPLCAIGVHTLTHPRLAKLSDEMARHELAESRRTIEARIDRSAPHLAYPVGDPTSAGPREFSLARDLGFKTAVTTRKGMIFPEHASQMLALPRLSINGSYQSRSMLDLLLTGAPFLLWNRGRMAKH